MSERDHYTARETIALLQNYSNVRIDLGSLCICRLYIYIYVYVCLGQLISFITYSTILELYIFLNAHLYARRITQLYNRSFKLHVKVKVIHIILTIIFILFLYRIYI